MENTTIEKDKEEKEVQYQPLSIKSVDEIAWIAKKWGELEMFISILSLKVCELAKEDFLPETFIMDTESKSVILVYDGGKKTRKFPMEILLVLNDPAVFSRLAEMYLHIIDSGMFEKPQEEKSNVD